MNNIEKFTMAVRAGYSFFYGQTYEADRYESLITKAIENDPLINNWPARTWNLEDYEPSDLFMIKPKLLDATDPVAQEQYQDQIKVWSRNSFEGAEINSIFICKNLNWFIENTQGTNYPAIQYFQNRLEKFSSIGDRKTILILSDEPYNSLPEAIRKNFLSLEFGLPNNDDIFIMLRDIIDNAKENPAFIEPDEKVFNQIITNAKGMTQNEINNAFALNLIENKGSFEPVQIAEIRSKNAPKGCKVHTADTLKDIPFPIGYEVAFDLIMSEINSPDSLGYCFVGPAGTGKTNFCKYLAKTTGKVLIEAELAQMMGEGLVGQAEADIKRFIDFCSVNEGAIIFIDE